MLFFAIAALAIVQPAPSYDTDLLLACSAVLGERPERPGLSIIDDQSSEIELKSFRVTAMSSGAFIRVFYDQGSERIARARAACLGEQILAIERLVADKRRGAEWDSVVFTQNADYIPPRTSGSVTRWTVNVAPNGTLPLSGHYMVVSAIPHEQVHLWQRRLGASLPRWVAEGHATWIQRQITPAFDPIVAAKVNRTSDRKLQNYKGSFDLEQWGSVQPKREAIMRQVSPEDRARMNTDPSYNPTGSFTFRPDDFEGDVAADAAGYPAANAIFVGLARKYGVSAVQSWMTSLSSTSGAISSQAARTSVEHQFRVVPPLTISR